MYSTHHYNLLCFFSCCKRQEKYFWNKGEELQKTLNEDVGYYYQINEFPPFCTPHCLAQEDQDNSIHCILDFWARQQRSK